MIVSRETFWEIDFEDRRKTLLPTLYFCLVFFLFYYLVLIIPKFGINSHVFLIDNMGGVFIVAGFLVGHFLSKSLRYNVILLLPCFGAIAASCLFLANKNFYDSVNHLWLSSQIIGIIFASFLGVPRWNVFLFFLNVTIPPLIASNCDHLSVGEIVNKQAIVYFSSLVSIFFSHYNIKKKKELLTEKENAIRSQKAKSIFLASMSHEIRTPMNGILSCANLLLDKVENSDSVKLLNTVQSCGDSLLTLIDDILDVSKIESGKLSLEKQPYNIRETLAEVVDLLSVKASENGVCLSFNVGESTPEWLIGDVTRVRQILLNLIGNAIKFTRSKVEIVVDVKQGDTKLPCLLLSVHDNGIGIEEETKDKIFDAFCQVDASTTRRYGGSGLGLSICKGIVLAMDGKIWVDSKINDGSIFYVSFPTRVGSSGESSPKRMLSNINPKMGKDHPLKILIAEDNLVNQLVVKKMFAKLGYEVDIVANGVEAVSAIENQVYDIVFIDQHMPELDGVEATKIICSKFSKDDRPRIVALTASVMAEDRIRCLKAGMDSFLTKPINIHHIVQELRLCDQYNEDEDELENRIIS